MNILGALTKNAIEIDGFRFEILYFVEIKLSQRYGGPYSLPFSNWKLHVIVLYFFNLRSIPLKGRPQITAASFLMLFFSTNKIMCHKDRDKKKEKTKTLGLLEIFIHSKFDCRIYIVMILLHHSIEMQLKLFYKRNFMHAQPKNCL